MAGCGEKKRRKPVVPDDAGTQLQGKTRSFTLDRAKVFKEDDDLVTLLTVAVKKPGRGVRSALTLPSANGRFRLEVAVSGEFSERTGSTPRQFVKLPELLFPAEVTRSDDTLEIVGKASEIPQIADKTAREAAQNLVSRHDVFVKDTHATVTVSKQGVVGNVTVKKPVRQVWETRREFARMWAEFVPVVPDEAIAVGATWRVTQAIPVAGTWVKQTCVYTLEKRDKNGWRAKVEWHQAGQLQPMLSPETPAGTRIEMVGMISERVGTVTVHKNGEIRVEMTGRSSFHGRSYSRTGNPVDFTSSREGPIRFAFLAIAETDAKSPPGSAMDAGSADLPAPTK